MRAVLGALLALGTTMAAAEPLRLASDFRTFPQPEFRSTFCHLTGTDARGALRRVTVRIDGQHAWEQLQAIALGECRAAYRLNDCTVVSCQ